MSFNTPTSISRQIWIVGLIIIVIVTFFNPVVALDYNNLSYGSSTVPQISTTSSAFVPSSSYSIISYPPGATIIFDGINIGKTPYIVENIGNGRYGDDLHTIVLKLDGYHEYYSNFRYPSESTSLDAYLIPAYGNIIFKSSPTGAAIFIDHVSEGITPKNVQVLKGEHEIILKKEGFFDYSKSINVIYGITYEINPKLNHLPPPGSVQITSIPPEAEIYINSSFEGTTPKNSTLQPGNYRVTLKKNGYFDYNTELKVFSGQESSILADLEPAILLSVSSSPSGCDVLIDGFYRGSTPLNLSDIKRGIHEINIRKSGYKTYTTSVTTELNFSTKVNATLISFGVTTNYQAIEKNNNLDTEPPGQPLLFVSPEQNGTNQTATDLTKIEKSPPSPQYQGILNPFLIISILLCAVVGGYYFLYSRKRPGKIFPAPVKPQHTFSAPADVPQQLQPKPLPSVSSPAFPDIYTEAEKNATTLVHYRAPVEYLLTISKQFYDTSNFNVAEHILKKAEALTESLKQNEYQITRWKIQGYDTTPLETMRSDDADIIFTKFREFEQGIGRMEKVKQDLDAIKRDYPTIITEAEFPSLVVSVEYFLKLPHRYENAESELEKLQVNIRDHIEEQDYLKQHLQGEGEKVLKAISDISILNETNHIMNLIRENKLSDAHHFFQELVSCNVKEINETLSELREDGAVIPTALLPVQKKEDDWQYGDLLIETIRIKGELDNLKKQFSEANALKNDVSNKRLLKLFDDGEYEYFIKEYKRQEKFLLSKKSETMQDLIFISSKSADYGNVLKLYNFLVSHEKNVFFSQESLPMMGNADYRDEIDKAIDRAKHMIVVGSSVENILSPWVKDEWGAFIIEKRSGRKPGSNLVTLIIGSVKIDELPISLRMNEVIPFDPEKFSTILNYLN